MREILFASAAAAGFAPPPPSLAPLTLTQRTRPVVAKLAPDEGAPIDTKLLAADVTLIFAFSFARTLCNILISPDFPGWAAELQEPLSADPERLAATINFSGIWASAWSASALALGAFTADLDEASVRRVGAVGAAQSFAVAAGGLGTAAIAWPAVLGDVAPPPPALLLSTDNALGALGLGAGLVAWRSLLAEASTPPRW